MAPSALTPTSVRSATDSDGVWTLSLTRDGSTERLVIDSATWTTPRAPTSSTTPDRAPAPAADVAPAPSRASAPQPAPESPAAEPETTTSVPEPPVTEEGPVDPVR